MIEAIAAVVKVDNHQVWVASGRNNTCAGCQQQASCPASGLDIFFSNKSLAVESNIPLKVGDQVMVAIEESVLLKASVLLYLPPLLAMFAGAGIADSFLTENFFYADLVIAACAMISLLLSLRLSNRIQRMFLKNHRAKPVVVERFSNAD